VARSCGPHARGGAPPRGGFFFFFLGAPPEKKKKKQPQQPHRPAYLKEVLGLNTPPLLGRTVLNRRRSAAAAEREAEIAESKGFGGRRMRPP